MQKTVALILEHGKTRMALPSALVMGRTDDGTYRTSPLKRYPNDLFYLFIFICLLVHFRLYLFIYLFPFFFISVLFTYLLLLFEFLVHVFSY